MYGIAILAPKINLIPIMGDCKSFQNNFPNEIMATISNTSYYRLMKLEFRTHAQHLSFEKFGKCNLCNLDDIADPNNDEVSAKFSNNIVEQIQYEKRLTLSSEKCELLKVNSRCKHGSITVNGENIKSVGVAWYLGDQFNSKGDYVDLCKERVGRAKGSTFELIALCREVKFGTRQIESMLILYQSVFLPRLICNCESWSNMTDKDYQALQSAQLLYLRNVVEVPRGTPIAALYLELGILPIKFEIEKRQLLFLRRMLNKDFDDPLQLVYNKQLKYEFEKNWANYMLELRHTYNLPLRENVRKMSAEQWKAFVNNVIRRGSIYST